MRYLTTNDECHLPDFIITTGIASSNGPENGISRAFTSPFLTNHLELASNQTPQAIFIERCQ
jgi:hypothetical protein